MPFINVIAGVLIGTISNFWLPRILIPFAWGLMFLVYVLVVERKRRDIFIREKGDKKAKCGMSSAQAFYFVEYLTATTTTLILSVISGGIKELFF